MKITLTEVYGFQAALRGMRNPQDSWVQSDSSFHEGTLQRAVCAVERPIIGPNDLKLARKLITAGGDHRKFMRMIMVWCDFVLPRYVWTEMDTYKVATVRNSCSTMNKLGKRDLYPEDFEGALPEFLLAELNRAAAEFRDPNQSSYEARVTLKNLLPEGYLQRATFMMSYETCFRILKSRRNHRLPMWSLSEPGSICHWIKGLPYMDAFTNRDGCITGAGPRGSV